MKLKKSLVSQEIARRNRKFKAASAAKKRVLIAEDVIAQVKAGRFKPQTGVWASPVTASGDLVHVEEKFYPYDSVRELFFERKIHSCECCALGAMFMSCTLYNNKTNVENFGHETMWFEGLVDGDGFSNGLTKFFSKDQLKLIEAAFEGEDGAFGESGNKKTDAWFSDLANDKKRLVAIMKNIIKNKGIFKP